MDPVYGASGPAGGQLLSEQVSEAANDRALPHSDRSPHEPAQPHSAPPRGARAPLPPNALRQKVSYSSLKYGPLSAGAHRIQKLYGTHGVRDRPLAGRGERYMWHPDMMYWTAHIDGDELEIPLLSLRADHSQRRRKNATSLLLLYSSVSEEHRRA